MGYTVEYTAIDNYGNKNYQAKDGICKNGKTRYIRTVIVQNTLAPVIALKYNGKLMNPNTFALGNHEDIRVGVNGQTNPATTFGHWPTFPSSLIAEDNSEFSRSMWEVSGVLSIATIAGIVLILVRNSKLRSIISV